MEAQLRLHAVVRALQVILVFLVLTFGSEPFVRLCALLMRQLLVSDQRNISSESSAAVVVIANKSLVFRVCLDLFLEFWPIVLRFGHSVIGLDFSEFVASVEALGFQQFFDFETQFSIFVTTV